MSLFPLCQNHQEQWILDVSQYLLKHEIWPEHITELQLKNIDTDNVMNGTKLFIYYLRMMEEMFHKPVNMEDFKKYLNLMVDMGFVSFINKTLGEIWEICISENCKK